MATCSWCGYEMTTADTCTIDAFHRDAQRVDMIPFGAERPPFVTAGRCGDCGVLPGRFHHPGCDIQQCPTCGGQMMTCGCYFDEDDEDDDDDVNDFDDEPFGVDGNGVLTERRRMGDHEVIIHYDDVPETDLTTVHGIPCTTALRTVIDIAPDATPAQLRATVSECLDRGLFTVREAWDRLDQPDMADRRGAEMLRQILPPCER